jgi:hypothetical protein
LKLNSFHRLIFILAKSLLISVCLKYYVPVLKLCTVCGISRWLVTRLTIPF